MTNKKIDIEELLHKNKTGLGLKDLQTTKRWRATHFQTNSVLGLHLKLN